MPTATGANTLGDPWYRSRHILPVRKDLVQETRYGLTALALRMLHKVEEFTLSNPPLMSRKSVDTFLPAIWRVLTSWVSVVVASEAEKPASEPHWCGSMRPAMRAMQESLEFMILSRILEKVCSNTMTRKEEGEFQEGFPGLSSTIPSAILRAGGWKPWATSGARRSWIRCGVTRCTFFQTELGVMSGPGAEDGDERARARLISSAANTGQSVNRSRMELGVLTGLPGKKWSSKALLSSGGVVAPGSSGKGGGRPTANFFTVQTVCGVAVARNVDQWSVLAFLIAFK